MNWKLYVAALGAICCSGASALEFESVPKLSLHGFVSQGYLYSTDMNYLADTTDGSSEFREYALNGSYQISDNLRFGAQVFGRRLGPLGNDELGLDWAFLDYKVNDAIGFRIGRMKLPMGLHNEYQDYDNLAAPFCCHKVFTTPCFAMRG